MRVVVVIVVIMVAGRLYDIAAPRVEVSPDRIKRVENRRSELSCVDFGSHLGQSVAYLGFDHHKGVMQSERFRLKCLRLRIMGVAADDGQHEDRNTYQQG